MFKFLSELRCSPVPHFTDQHSAARQPLLFLILNISRSSCHELSVSKEPSVHKYDDESIYIGGN